jgi:hypothetical protein
VLRDTVRKRVKSYLQQGLAAAQLPETSRTDLLALSELARRIGGDVPTGGKVLELALYELKVFSQNGEDGVLAEIVRRTGAPGRWFVEFGAGYGIESNTAVFADLLGWSGLLIDAADAEYAGLEHKYGANRRVRIAKSMVTPANVEELFRAHGVPEEPDVLSIDVNGTDYWIWEALRSYRPRIVVIEYNGELPPGRRLVQPREHGEWDMTRYYGASIGALVGLGDRKGYRLVHCDLTGNNAFFVRGDLPGDYVDPRDVMRRPSNFWLAGVRHDPDPAGRASLDRHA